MIQSAFDHDTFLRQVAEAFCRRGLRLPALVALEAGRPLAFLGGQLLWVTQPLVSLFLPASLIHQAARVLEDPNAVDALIACLEAQEG